MKYVKSILFAIILLYLQVLFIVPIKTIGLIPNLLIAYIVYLSIYINQTPALIIAFLLGLALDLTTPFTLGVNCGLFVILTKVVYSTHSLIDKEKITNNLLAIFFVNLIYYFFTYVAQSIADSFSANMLWQFLLNTIVNSILSFIIAYILVILHKLKLVVDENYI
jgi:rod shape-determining protein MreD